LAGAATIACASCFNKPFFKNLFDTLCVLMEHYYDPIIEGIEDYFLEFAEEFMKHNNKYIRKFSVQAFSYLLGNLTE
jgi:disulfide oxidoreductase YuzD